ncbi:Repressible acid phosphatase [Hyphodiscus hymeniophilus]|uniref:Repressible acid phosphatase n=1 Tax=Hyphodiscus hymeniophilus TaxID=353542 RepID=A0A9P6VF78_9HELO|nr:Repressible acid phosphatase [Hyphodiscus hymeniophilus]
MHLQHNALALAALLVPALAVQVPLRLTPQSHSQDYKFDALLHLPGISPYFDAIGSGLDHTAPRHCEVTAASYLIRHAAIYANDDDYENYIEPFINKLDSTYSSDPPYYLFSGKRRKGWKGSLAFFSKWKNPIDDPENQMEKITPQGIIDSRKVGKHLLSRYPNLVPTTKRIYADKKSRTKDTAKAFVQSFPQDVEVVEINLNRSSFHAQDPHKACKAFSKEPGQEEQGRFMSFYTQPIIQRLQPQSPVQLTQTDIMGMQQLCGQGEGEIPDDDGQRFFLAFTHREVPPFIATALGLFNSSNAHAEEFPTDRINWSRSWRMAELIPFLGHVGIEKLTCHAASTDPEDGHEYIRIIANSAPRPIPSCQDGPGASCSFHKFEEIVGRGMEEYGDFDGICKNNDDDDDDDDGKEKKADL